MTKGLICQNLEILLSVKALPSCFLLQERRKTIETHQDIQELTSFMDFLQDSTLGLGIFSNFQYLLSFSQDIQDLVF